jgi:hypothetical protein
MLDLEDLRLSGRIVLAPLSSLAQLTRLRVLALTQDVQVRRCCMTRMHAHLAAAVASTCPAAAASVGCLCRGMQAAN